MAIYEINPFQDDKSQTNSKDLQNAFNLLQEGDELRITAGTSLIDNSIPGGDHSFLSIPSGARITGDIDQNGKPTTILQLMKNAPIKPFGCSMPILGPKDTIGQNIDISNIFFDGNNPIGNGSYQLPSTAAVCAGTAGPAGRNYGKGFHNFLGALNACFRECNFENIYVKNSAGDGFRNHYLKNITNYKSSNLTFKNWNVENCGHCGIMLENTDYVDILNFTCVTRSNGAVRTQNNCKNIKIDNAWIIGTTNNYNSGLQLTGDNISISNSLIYDCYGPGIELCCQGNTGIEIFNNTLINNGNYPGSDVSGLGGVVLKSCDAYIHDNFFYGNYSNSLAVTSYSPNGKSYMKSGFNIISERNKYINTQPSPRIKPAGNGKAIVNLLDGHTITSKSDYFWPLKNYTQGNIVWG